MRPPLCSGGTDTDRGGTAVGLVIAALLVATVLAIAGPGQVWRLLRGVSPGPLAAAAAASAAAIVARGVRLVLLLPHVRVGWRRATLVAAAAQAAALFTPARLGELALPWLLFKTREVELSKGVATLLAARALDTAALGAWGGAAVIAVWGFAQPVALVVSGTLLLLPLLLPSAFAGLDRLAVRLLARHGLRGRRWARRLRQVRLALDHLAAQPARLAGAAGASLAMWACLWAVAWFLLAAMGHRWPVVNVVAGSAAASLSNLVPVNVVGNLGTLEAGWTAAFAALGVPVDVAAATGLASHLWSLLFAAVYGAAAWITLPTASTE